MSLLKQVLELIATDGDAVHKSLELLAAHADHKTKGSVDPHALAEVVEAKAKELIEPALQSLQDACGNRIKALEEQLAELSKAAAQPAAAPEAAAPQG
jgi:hypothetical protein